MPRGSRAPISFLLVSATSEKAPSIARTASMNLSMKRGCRLWATRCRMTSVSDVDWQIAPSCTQLFAQGQRIGQMAVMADREAARREIREQGLHVAQYGVAGGRVANVADRALPAEPVHRRLFGKMIADQAETALGIELLAVERDDAGCFLSAMLQGMQTERRERC